MQEIAKRVLPNEIMAHSIVKDGFLPGFVPAFRVVTVTVDGNGKAKVEASKQKYILAEAQAIVEDKMAESLGI